MACHSNSRGIVWQHPAPWHQAEACSTDTQGRADHVCVWPTCSGSPAVAAACVPASSTFISSASVAASSVADSLVAASCASEGSWAYPLRLPFSVQPCSEAMRRAIPRQLLHPPPDVNSCQMACHRMLPAPKTGRSAVQPPCPSRSAPSIVVQLQVRWFCLLAAGTTPTGAMKTQCGIATSACSRRGCPAPASWAGSPTRTKLRRALT